MVVVVVVTRSLWRKHHMEELPLASETILRTQRNPHDLVQTMTRAKLMGSQTSVAQELDDIRKWHIEHGYKGGLVLRELNKPLFWTSFSSNKDDSETTPEFDYEDPTALARRECYYLYYEVKGDGQVRQQIFCRGTTLQVDILTCLQFWWVYDDDLNARVHRGFRNHANHVLRDVLPLLAPPSDKRATIEVCGHSLGGAVAFLLATKLKLLGYNVVKLTTVAAPRFCNASSVHVLKTLIPKDTLRIEDDVDMVPFLPPFGHSLGDKLWLVDKGPARFVPYSVAWTDSFLVNFRIGKVLSSFYQHHRVGSYIRQLEKSIMEEDGS